MYLELTILINSLKVGSRNTLNSLLMSSICISPCSDSSYYYNASYYKNCSFESIAVSLAKSNPDNSLALPVSVSFSSGMSLSWINSENSSSERLFKNSFKFLL